MCLCLSWAARPWLFRIKGLQESREVPQPAGAIGLFQGLVLREDVNKAFADVVPMVEEELAATVAKPQRVDDA